MNLLTEGIKQNLVIKTDMAKKLTIDGNTKTYPVYKVHLDCLYYNDRNDRIATWISKYKSEKGISDFDKKDLELYNSVIQKFIEDSNPEAIARTQNNINLVGQQHPGVVLVDGRIIDGNRRYTCLRNLSKEDTRKNNYFETVILEHRIESSEKQIKMLELQLQMGEESRVDYNPIDRLVGIYQDIVENKLLTVKEYADSTNRTTTEVEKDVDLAKLLVEYLEFINAPKKFFIAREQDLNGPLVELQSILKSTKDEDYKDQIKATVFANLLLQPSGDMTRYIRNIKGLVKEPETKYLDEYLEKSLPVVEEVVEELAKKETVDQEIIATLRKKEEPKEELRQATEIATTKVKAQQTKNLPLQNLSKAILMLKSIDMGIFAKLSESQQSDFIEKFQELKGLCNQIEGEMDVSES